MPRLKDRDLRFASPQERDIARKANRKAGWPNRFEGQDQGAFLPPRQAQAA